MADVSFSSETGDNVNISTDSAHKRSEQIFFLGMEIGTSLSVEIPGAKIRFSSSLVGLQQDQFVIIKLPPLTGTRHALKPGVDVVVRFVSGGSIFGFKSQIIQAHFEPLGVGFLKFPLYAERICLRKLKRLQCFFAAQADIRGSILEGAVLDINTKGCRFSVDDTQVGLALLGTIEKGDTLMLSVETFGDDLIEGKIANVRNDGGLHSFGIEFTKISPEVQEKIDGMQNIASRIQY